MEVPQTSEQGIGDQGKSLKDMETSINVGNNRLAVLGGINRQTTILTLFFTLLPSALQSTPDLK